MRKKAKEFAWFMRLENVIMSMNGLMNLIDNISVY